MSKEKDVSLLSFVPKSLFLMRFIRIGPYTFATSKEIAAFMPVSEFRTVTDRTQKSLLPMMAGRTALNNIFSTT